MSKANQSSSSVRKKTTKRPTRTGRAIAARSPDLAKAPTSRRPKRSKKGRLANYAEAIHFLNDRVDIERARAGRLDKRVFKLDRMKRLMAELEHPEEAVPCVHVAGTNGKGSIVAMLSSCLQECGCAVGSYTSPHLVDVRERITINGAMISHQRFTEQMNRVAEAVDALPARLGEPTYFELLTSVAFLHFAEQAVDLMVIEVGLGGRLDSTNVVRSDVTVVAGIALDHTQILGQTVEEIATEKGGIFRESAAALTFSQDKKVLAVLRSVAQDRGATLEVVGDEIDFSYRFEASPQLGPHMRVGLSTPRSTFEHIPVPLPGEHQALNCGLVLAILDKLSERGLVDVTERQVISGLGKASVPGRMEMAWERPRVLIDGAHNPAAIKALVRSLGAHIPYDSLVVVFGCSADKDVPAMLKQLGTGADKVIFTRATGNPRAADPADLARGFAEVSPKMCQPVDSLTDALSVASRAAGRDDLICVTGSFFLVGEAKKLLASKAQKLAAS